MRQAWTEQDKAALIRDVWTMFNSNLSKMYKPTENVTIDEQLYPYRGHTIFTQYIPSKPAKYGIKICAMLKTLTLWKELFIQVKLAMFGKKSRRESCERACSSIQKQWKEYYNW